VLRRQFLLAVPLCLGAQGIHNRLTIQEQRSGWRLLFDGTATNGWIEITGRPFPETWRVEDGCLRAIPGAHGNQDIRTEATFTDFELWFAWRILKDGNSGVKYLVQNTDRWTNAQGLQARARGPEYQLVDDTSEDAQEPARKTGSLYSVYPPASHPARAPGEWNESQLVVRGNRVEHWLNGERVLAYGLDDAKVIDLLRMHRKGEDIVRSSPIALQNHGTPAWFRDLKIRILE
jgi:hypothetical protein